MENKRAPLREKGDFSLRKRHTRLLTPPKTSMFLAFNSLLNFLMFLKEGIAFTKAGQNMPCYGNCFMADIVTLLILILIN